MRAPVSAVGSLPIILLLITLCSGCASTAAVKCYDESLATVLPTTIFYLELEDGSTGSPDNVDGYLNLM
jgi:hypothetical protein